jgi:hypothetical protein
MYSQRIKSFMKNRRILLFLLATITTISKSIAQPILSGHTCAMTGTVYQYVISGTLSPTSSIKLSVTGGVITGSAGVNITSLIGPPVNHVLVIWNDSLSGAGSLALNAAEGNASVTVHVCKALKGGILDTGSSIQMISDTSKVPLPLTCGAATGGSCSPSFAYQWQESPNMLSWSDIPGATGPGLIFTGPVRQSTYYRRKATDISTGSIGYSDVGSVFILISASAFSSGTDNPMQLVTNVNRPFNGFIDPDSPGYPNAINRRDPNRFGSARLILAHVGKI